MVAQGARFVMQPATPFVLPLKTHRIARTTSALFSQTRLEALPDRVERPEGWP